MSDRDRAAQDDAYVQGRRDAEKEFGAAQSVDWLGLALDLEQQARRVESKTAERAMLAAARGLRLMGGES